MPGTADVLRMIRRPLFATRVGRRLALLASATAAGQLALLLAAPLVTRLYAPEDYGAFVALSGLIGVLAVITGLRYEGAIPLCRNDEDASALAAIVILTSAVLALAAAALLSVAGPRLAVLLGLGANSALVWWLPPALAVQGLFLAFDGWSLYRSGMRQLALSKITQGVVVAVGQLTFGVVGGGDAHGLFLAYVLGQVASVYPLASRLDRRQRLLFLRPSPARMFRLARRFKHFPAYETWSRGFGTGAEMLPAPLIAVVFGPAAAGFFGLAQRIVGIPIRFLGISASQVYIAELASLDRGDRHALRGLFDETVRRLLLAGAIYLAVVLVLGPQIFALVFGTAWSESGVMAQLLAPMYLAMFVNRPIRYTVQFYERQDLSLAINASSLAIVVATFMMAHIGFLSLSSSIITVSAGLCITNMLFFMVARALIAGRLAAHAPSEAVIGERQNAT